MNNFTKETVKDTLYMNLDKCIVLEPMKMEIMYNNTTISLVFNNLIHIYKQ